MRCDSFCGDTGADLAWGHNVHNEHARSLLYQQVRFCLWDALLGVCIVPRFNKKRIEENKLATSMLKQRNTLGVQLQRGDKKWGKLGEFEGLKQTMH